MGCNTSKLKSESVIIVKSLKTPTIVDSPDKLPIKPGQFVLKKTSSLQQDYELGPVLGAGAFGTVRTAIHKQTGQERAIKSVKKEKLSKSSFSIPNFLLEIEILKQIDHPNIIKIFEFYEDSKFYHIVSEVVKGGELFEFLVSSQFLSEAIASHFMKQILCAVNYCHKRGIVHKDLKPENLLLERRSPNANLKVIDFGASSIYSPSHSLSKRCGTSYYIAPEVLAKNYNEKCDLWSCGVILYVLLSGKPPFDGKDNKEVLKKVQKGKFSISGPEWHSISEAAKDLIQKLMEFDPHQRISAEEALKHDWFLLDSEIKHSKNMPSVLENMQKFRVCEKFQSAVLTFITSQLVSQEEIKQLAEVFKEIDKDGDGKLSREELVEEYKKNLQLEDAENEVERILKEVDEDLNGYIDYSEFLMASLKREKLISKRNLETAFQIFDRDGNGSISADELKSILGVNVVKDSGLWEKIIGKVDKNGDGVIDLNEFKEMMLGLFDQHN